MDYYNEYCIDNFDKLQSKLNSKGHLNQDVRIKGEFPTLGKLNRIIGHLSVDSEFLEDLGELSYIKTDLWIHNVTKLKTLCNLEKVGGNINLRYSNIQDLGELSRVGGDLNLRDTEVSSLGNLKYIGGNLFLPKRLIDLNLESIEIKGAISYWNDKKDSKIENLKNDLEWSFQEYFSDIHSKEIERKKKYLTGEYLVKRCYNLSQYNQYIIDNLTDFIDFVEFELINLYEDKYSFFHALFNELKSIDELNNEFPKIKVDKRVKMEIRHRQLKELSNEFLQKHQNQNPIVKYYSLINFYKNNEDWNGKISSIWLGYDEHELGNSESCCNYEWDPYKGENVFRKGFIYFVENKIFETFSIFIDILQNKFRISRGLPKIGEGWVGETSLYYLIKQKFDQYEIIQHGSPTWLGRQHLDIWIPELKIGIEYQGAQHDKPVEFFGGQIAFDENLKRDARKRQLCKENGIKLIEVREGYSIDELILLITE